MFFPLMFTIDFDSTFLTVVFFPLVESLILINCELFDVLLNGANSVVLDLCDDVDGFLLDVEVEALEEVFGG
jgi:hypothetical protein